MALVDVGSGWRALLRNDRDVIAAWCVMTGT
jgi:hypothetical protein